MFPLWSEKRETPISVYVRKPISGIGETICILLGNNILETTVAELESNSEAEITESQCFGWSLRKNTNLIWTELKSESDQKYFYYYKIKEFGAGAPKPESHNFQRMERNVSLSQQKYYQLFVSHLEMHFLNHKKPFKNLYSYKDYL